MGMWNVMSTRWAGVMDGGSFASLLRGHGVDLTDADPEELASSRGTPVYVEADADSITVLRHMALADVRLLFVLERDEIVGAVDGADVRAGRRDR